MTEVPLCRPMRQRQEVGVATRRLVKAKGFRVAIKNCSVATGFHGVVLRQGILCCNKVWPRPKGLVS